MGLAKLCPPPQAQPGFGGVTLSPEVAQEGAPGAGEPQGLAWQAALGLVMPLHPGTTLRDGEGSGYSSC